jgi:hypothetical protein
MPSINNEPLALKLKNNPKTLIEDEDYVNFIFRLV